MTTDRLLKIAEVSELTGLGRSTIYRRIGEGRFPAAYDLGGGCVRWSEAEVAAWRAQLRHSTAGAASANQPAAASRP